MAALTVQQIVTTGLEAAYVSAAAGGDTIANTGRQFAHVVNGSGGDITVTVVTSGTYKGKAIADDAIVVTAGESRFIGPWDPEIYNNSSGLVPLAYSGVTSLTVAAFQL